MKNEAAIGLAHVLVLHIFVSSCVVTMEISSEQRAELLPFHGSRDAMLMVFVVGLSMLTSNLACGIGKQNDNHQYAQPFITPNHIQPE